MPVRWAAMAKGRHLRRVHHHIGADCGADTESNAGADNLVTNTGTDIDSNDLESDHQSDSDADNLRANRDLPALPPEHSAAK